jgi:hypothetical protein
VSAAPIRRASMIGLLAAVGLWARAGAQSLEGNFAATIPRPCTLELKRIPS